MNSYQKNIVVGTAGHVGHGKTTLIKTLTGTNTDRLKEEKEKGMTIEPGFASLQLSSGKVLSVIDVPGHERLVKNMLRGIFGVDVAILVISSDTGVMPQTREHLDILRLLNVRHGLIVLSKIDFVDKEIIGIAHEEVRDFVEETFLENTPIIHFSAETGQGVEEIKQTLEDISRQVMEKNQGGIFRLPIDRVFTMPGHGTIVTGTVISGRVSKGDVVEVYPIGKLTNIRNIQIHGQWVGDAVAGHRVGLNLSDVRIEEIEKGMVVSERQSLQLTNIVNAKFHYLQSNTYHLNSIAEVKLYSGTYEVVARSVLMNKEKLLPGESCFIQMKLQNSVALLPYDRYILRALNPVDTIGGGIILEVGPEKYRSSRDESIEYLELLDRRNIYEMVESSIKKESLATVKTSELAKKFYTTQREIDEACIHLLREGRILFIEDGSLIHKKSVGYLEKEILEKIASFHDSHPSQKDASQEEIRLKISPLLSQRLYETTLHDLKNKKEIEINKGRIRLAGFRVRLNEKQRQIHDRLEEICRSYHFRHLPSNVLQIIKDSYGEKEVEDVLMFMIGEGRLIKLNNRRFIHSDAIEDAKKVIRNHIEQKGQVALRESMKLFGVGRPQIQPIFDYLDSIRFTMRIGDYRVLYKSRESEYV
jgi:selenocysteine-specific elongation factor